MLRQNVVRQIARREFLELRRNRGFGAVLALVVILLTMSLLSGWRDCRRTLWEIERTQRDERARWLNQGVKGPHAAADQGILVFQLIGVPAALDPGVLPYCPFEHLLVGHHEELAVSKAAEGTHTLHRLGSLTSAKTLQVFVPLLLVLVLYPAFAAERQNGTLRQTLSLGVSSAELSCGKLAGLALPLACILSPVAILGAAVLSLTGAVAVDQHDYAARVAAMAGLYLIYFALVGAISLAVSARCSTTRQSLSLLLALWFCGCILVPVVTVNAVESASPSPSAFEHTIAMMETQEKLPTVEERRAEVRARLLKQYRAASLRDLPVDPIGVELLEEARQAEPLYHAVVGRVYDSHRRQARLYQLCGILSPLIPLRSLSMAVAGTDLEAHRAFLDAAERYRSGMVRILNEAIAYNPHYRESAVFPGTDIIVSQYGNELWSRIPAFSYRPPPLPTVASNSRRSLVLLAGWGLFAAVLLWRCVGRLKAS